MEAMKRYGADARWLEEASRYPELYLARVVSQSKDLYSIVTAEATCLAKVAGKLRYGAESAVAFVGFQAEGSLGRRLLDDQGFYGHAVLRALVDLYRQQSGGVLECMAGTADLQEEEASGPAAEQAMTAQEAVDLMATNITRYERELATSYGDRFPDMRPRLTVAGLLQLGYYVLVDHSIPLAALVQAADEAASADDPVVEYVEKLEVEVFCAEGGEKERKRVEDACHLLRSRILDVVLQTRADFDAAPSLSQATRNFMEESEFEPLRQAVGIRPAG